MATRQYHIGLRPESYARKPYKGKLIIEARRCIDYLDCELWEYMGLREITKKQLRENRFDIMRWVNREYQTNFTKVEVN